MEGLSLQTMTNRSKFVLRQKMEKQNQEQRRSLLYLIADFLREQGLFKSLDALNEEAQISENYEICDNVDLEIIFNDYISYYQARFNKSPQICKIAKSQTISETPAKVTSGQKNGNKQKPKCLPLPVSEDPINMADLARQSQDDFGLSPSVIALPEKRESKCELKEESINSVFKNEKTLRSLGNLYATGSEWREIAEMITREIVTSDLNVHWNDIHGLKECKKLLKEAIIYPTKYPELFNDLFTPWKGILLYGPPGTGKTMLAKAVATECDLTFFNISASSLVSKWRGDSEKYVRVLFELANYHAPSIIFIDEIDWIAAGEGASSSDRSEPARRFRAELLSRLDGLNSVDDSRVILLAATNAPWNLDSALLRRLENHVHVDVPNEIVRREILEIYTHKNLHENGNLVDAGRETHGYSPADLKRLCKKTWMIQMRPIWEKLEKEPTRNVNEWLHKAHSIVDSSLLYSEINNILCTANSFNDKYKAWKKNCRRSV